jgi:hypothetical protein
MADPSRYPSDGDDSSDRGTAGHTPRWVLAVGIIIAILLVLLFVVLHLTGRLGPGAH